MRPTAIGEITTAVAKPKYWVDRDRDIGAERVEGAMRQVDDPARR